MALDIPVKEKKSIPNRIVGVDLGIEISAYVSLNDKPNIKEKISYKEKGLKVWTAIQTQRRRLQIDSDSNRSGKGYQRKMKSLEKLKKKEKNFRKNHSHIISKKIVDFAVKHNAESIHLEKLSFNHKKKKRKNFNDLWSYYQIQIMIVYKAHKKGIKVYFVDPSYTSQTCSQCGNLEEGQRVRQELFKCKKCGFEANADYNASQNIANAKPIEESDLNEKFIKETDDTITSK